MFSGFRFGQQVSGTLRRIIIRRYGKVRGWQLIDEAEKKKGWAGNLALIHKQEEEESKDAIQN